MIRISDKALCCGCTACAQACPKQCIALHADKEGFLYPQVDMESCVDCGRCERVCPELRQNEERKPAQVYAARHPDETVRRESSSGGIFTLLADMVIDMGGVVFGARFDDSWNVVHDYTETRGGLDAFRRSKYVQSRIGDTYRQAGQFLESGRKVMYTGTPCQIAGLKKYLRKDYDNLLAVDFVCHGVPSPLVWQKYLKETVARQCEKNTVSSHPKPLLPERDGIGLEEDVRINAISFRNKSFGWKKYSFALTLSKVTTAGEENSVSLSSVFHENRYMQAFLANLSLRPSCYNCPAKAGKSGSDITLGDFWGIDRIAPELDDDLGCSLLTVSDPQVLEWIKRKGIPLQAYPFAEAARYNPCLTDSVAMPAIRRKLFFLALDRAGFYKAAELVAKVTWCHRALRKIRTQSRKIRTQSK